jgi:cysteine-S-conjugate beta-lyase
MTVVFPPLSALRERTSAKWRAYPAGVLPLTVAEMDVELAPPIRDALRAAVDASDLGYSYAAPGLGRAYAGFAADRWGWTVDPAQVTAVTDVGVGVVELLRVFGGTVAFSPPVYPPFFDWTPESGTRALEVPLTSSFRLDLEALERAFQTRPSVYVLCNPHNPVGRVHTRDELAALVALATRHDVTIISDEIHAPLVLAGATYTPLLSVPGAAAVAVSVVSASKAFNLAGLKCAAVVTASDGMADAVRRFPPDAVWRTGHLGVIATVAAFRDGGPWLDALLAELSIRRAQLGSLLTARLPGVRWTPPEATYLAWLDCRGAATRAAFLEAGVAVEPGERFGAGWDGWVRLNFGTSFEVIDQATAMMADAVAR